MSAPKPPSLSSQIDKTRAIDAMPVSVRRHGVFTISNGLEAGRVLALPRTQATFGRSKECMFSFDDSSLSREHATVLFAAGEYLLRDSSTNGTFVNDVRVTTPVALRDGDRLQLGSNTVLRFALVDDQEEAALRKVYEAAILDGLTGIYNRKHLEDRIAAALVTAERHGEALSVIILDVDHFKKVNDTFGHLAGDAVLKSVSALVARAVRPTDIVGRYGGEEFVVLAPETDAATAVTLAEQLRAKIAGAEITFETHAIPVTSSAGVAALTCCGATRDRATLIGTADRRLYAAKEGGRNRVVGP